MVRFKIGDKVSHKIYGEGIYKAEGVTKDSNVFVEFPEKRYGKLALGGGVKYVNPKLLTPLKESKKESYTHTRRFKRRKSRTIRRR